MTGVKSSIDYYINAFLTIAALRNILKNETARPLTIPVEVGSGAYDRKTLPPSPTSKEWSAHHDGYQGAA
jgi:hypothetical protein